MYSKSHETPNHEKIIGLYRYHNNRGFVMEFSKALEPYKMDTNAMLQIACRDLTPSFDHHLNQERLRAIKALILQGADPTYVDSDGNNALMLLFRDMSKLRPFESRGEKIYSASRGAIEGIAGDHTPYITNERGVPVYKSQDPEDFNRLVNIYGDRSIIQNGFVPYEGELEAYKLRLDKEMEQLKQSHADQAVEMLVGAGFDINAKNKFGKSALMIAEEGGHQHLKKALLEHGANEFDLLINDPRYSYLNDRKNFENIACARSGCKWKPFTKMIFSAVNNKTRDIQGFPHVTSNQDGSLSFSWELGTENDMELRSFIEQESFAKQLEFRSFDFRDRAKKIFELRVDEVAGVAECKINLTADQLDEIMMLNDDYRGYRNENSLLKLNKEFVMKDGVIRLFPLSKEVVSIEQDGVLRDAWQVAAVGCQIFEMPSVQLMRMLPSYESEIAPDRKKKGNYFHWMPKEVNVGLGIDSSDLMEILNKAFQDNGFVVTEGGMKRFYENPDFLFAPNPPRENCAIRIVELDQNSRDFYALYGVTSYKDLENCNSVEIDSLAFLKLIKEKIVSKSEKNNSAIETIDSMISFEEKRVIESRQAPMASIRRSVSEHFLGGSASAEKKPFGRLG